MPSRFISGEITLRFKIDGQLTKAIFQYKYYPEEELIRYTDIEYTHPKLQEKIESDPQMMERVDLYVRKIIEKK